MTGITESTIEKRRHPRTMVQMTLKGVRLDPDGGDVVNLLRMMDISRSGMGATSPRHLYPGQRLVLCLPMTDATGRRNIYATVRRCGQAEGAYDVGLEFDGVAISSSRGVDTLAAA